MSDRSYEAFEKEINVPLLRDLVTHVTLNTDVEKEDWEDIWIGCDLFPFLQSTGTVDQIEEKYGFNYFGELLERYSSRHGDNVADTRAIMLALALTVPLHAKDMFYGRQKQSFVSRIKKLAASDMFLLAALYIYDLQQKGTSTYREVLLEHHYASTTEVLFSLFSLYSDKSNFTEAYDTLLPQVSHLFGPGRTIPIIHNEWCFLHFLNLVVNEKVRNKKKDAALIRALISLCSRRCREGSSHHKQLLSAGYSKCDIAYCNFEFSVMGGIYEISNTSLDSILAEKLAADVMIHFLNSDIPHSKEMYEYLHKLYLGYRSFDKKYDGNEGIFDAIRNELAIINPLNLAFLINLEELGWWENRRVFSKVDILNPVWDELTELLGPEKYLRFFDLCMEFSCKGETEAWENRYFEATGQRYIDTFYRHYQFERTKVFILMVNAGRIRLVEAIQRLETTSKEDWHIDLKKNICGCLTEYIRQTEHPIRHRKAFIVLRYLFSKMSCTDIAKLMGRDFDLESLFGDFGYRIFKLSVSQRCKLDLLGWMDNWIFTYGTEHYMGFIRQMLSNSTLQESGVFPELSKVFQLCDENQTLCGIDTKDLRPVYFSKEKIKELEAKEEADRVLLAEQEKAKHHIKVRYKLRSYYDGTLASIENSIRYFYSDDSDILWDEIEKIIEQMDIQTLEHNDAIVLLSIWHRMLKEKRVDWETIVSHFKVTREEKAYA